MICHLFCKKGDTKKLGVDQTHIIHGDDVIVKELL